MYRPTIYCLGELFIFRLIMDPDTLAVLRVTHELYCQLTGQKLSLRFYRERLWYEFLRGGFSAQDLKRVVTYLQRKSAPAAARRRPEIIQPSATGSLRGRSQHQQCPIAQRGPAPIPSLHTERSLTTYACSTPEPPPGGQGGLRPFARGTRKKPRFLTNNCLKPMKSTIPFQKLPPYLT